MYASRFVAWGTNNETRNENTGARIQNKEVRRQTRDDREQKKALRMKM
jgi:hypothetical protein